MVRFQGVTKRFGRLLALDRLDLEVPPGETLALLGPNGAGKTTAIRILTGQLRPDAGRVLLAGHDVWRRPIPAKQSFGYVPDRPFLYGKLTGVEFLRFVAGLYRIPAGEAEQRIEEELVRFRLVRHASALIETYSHGMRQKLTFAAALLPRPPVLVADEPMVGLDPVAARTVRELLAGYSKPDRAVFFSTHQLELAEAVADRVALLNDGRVVLCDRPQAIRRAYGEKNLEEVFLRLTEDAHASPPDLPS